MKQLFTCLWILAVQVVFAQPCSRETFTDVSDKIISRGYRLIDHKADAARSVMGAMNFVFFAEPGNDYVFVITTKEPLMSDESIGVNIYDSTGRIASRLINDNLTEVHFTPAKGGYVTIDAWIRSTSKNRDRFCIYHLLAVRKLERDE
jgi:hypothetical protein